MARRTVQRLDLGPRIENTRRERHRRRGTAAGTIRRVDALEEEPILYLAIHLETIEQVDALAFFTRATFTGERFELDRLDALCNLVRQTLARPILSTGGAR